VRASSGCATLFLLSQEGGAGKSPQDWPGRKRDKREPINSKREGKGWGGGRSEGGKGGETGAWGGFSWGY